MKYTLVGVDGNAFCIMGYVRRAMQIERFPQSSIDGYLDAAKSGDYDNLIRVSLEQIEQVNDFDEFWDYFQEVYPHIFVSKRVAVEYFLKSGNRVDQFADYLLANDLAEEVVE